MLARTQLTRVPASHAPTPRLDCLSATRSGPQFLPVSGYITDRLFVTYRAPAHALRVLVPAPLEIDEFAGFGFVSVCAVEILNMGLAWTPRVLRWDNRELLYRVAVRYRGRSTFVTLQSHVSSRILAVLGRFFSHYRPEHSQVRLTRDAARVRFDVATRNADGHAVLEVMRAAPRGGSTSVFATEAQATQFLLGMDFSVDLVGDRVRGQLIEHTPWHPRFGSVVQARFAYLRKVERLLGVSLELDSVLVTSDVRQVWRAARWM
jgi:hypothetical protein